MKLLDHPALSSMRHTVENARKQGELTNVTRSVLRGVMAPRRRILCGPRSYRGRLLLGRIIARNGYRIVLDPKERHDVSVRVPSDTAAFVVNARHADNRKTRVARLWEEASGRRLEVDPTTYTGAMVEKSDANATHDGRVVQGPIPVEEVVEGKVYQLLIDNAEGREVVDLRVTFHGGALPLVYRKRRPLETRFSNTNTHVDLVETEAVFDADEVRSLLKFADLAGLDFGEADVLRDAASGKIWIVDSTNGPAGPPNGLAKDAQKVAVDRLAAAFEDMLRRKTAAAR